MRTPENSLQPHLVEGVLKRYPDIGDHPDKVLSNPPKGSIEPLQKALSNPRLAPEKVH